MDYSLCPSVMNCDHSALCLLSCTTMHICQLVTLLTNTKLYMFCEMDF